MLIVIVYLKRLVYSEQGIRVLLPIYFMHKIFTDTWRNNIYFYQKLKISLKYKVNRHAFRMYWKTKTSMTSVFFLLFLFWLPERVMIRFCEGVLVHTIHIWKQLGIGSWEQQTQHSKGQPDFFPKHQRLGQFTLYQELSRNRVKEFQLS